ncbi:hypothetical protein ACHAXN_012103 [Cyclotella atomus]
MYSSSRQSFSNLLATTLSTIIHQLLHSRAIYPADSFVLHRYLGVRCHASRVPSVANYIRDFLNVAVPSLVSGLVESIVMIVLEEEIIGESNEGKKVAMKILERYEFKFEMDETITYLNYKAAAAARHDDFMMYEEEGSKSAEQCKEEAERAERMRLDALIANEARIHLEHSMKQCLLGVFTLERRRKRVREKPQNLSFKLCMQTSDAVSGECTDIRRSCPQLSRAVSSGQWHVPNESSCLLSRNKNTQNDGTSSRKGLYRPIKDVSIPTCGMRMSFGMQIG